MPTKYYGLLLAAIWLVMGATELGASPQASEQQPSLGLQKQEFVVKLLSPVSTKTSKKGDSLSAVVISPPAYEKASLVGEVQQVKPAKKSQKAEISFAFTKIVTGGRNYVVEADLQEVTNSRGAKGVDEEGRVIGKSRAPLSVRESVRHSAAS
jgi:hypothetical protein